MDYWQFPSVAQSIPASPLFFLRDFSACEPPTGVFIINLFESLA